MSRSRNKYSRAVLRAKNRRSKRRGSNAWFAITMSVIVIVGIVGVVLAAGVLDRDDDASAAPQAQTATTPGDHWHAAFAVNVCGEWLDPPPEFEQAADNPNVQPGIHTHGDGFIHIHPFYSSEEGGNATLGKFMDYGGWSVSSDSFDVWTGPSFEPRKTEWSNGDRCPNGAGEAVAGKPGRLVFQINCRSISGDPADHKLADQEVVAIGFLPKGQKLEAPPNAASAPDVDVEGDTPQAINQKDCRPTAENNPGLPGTAPAATTPTTAASTTPTTSR